MNYFKNQSKILILAILACASFAVSAQDFTYGAKAGLNIANLNPEDDFTTKLLLGVYVGLFGNYAINQKFAIQPELFFSTGGAKWDYHYTTNPTVGVEAAVAYDVAGEIKTSSITLPVMLQYKIIDALYVEAGPQYNFLLSIKESINGDSDDDIKDSYKTGTFGFGIGVDNDLSTFTPGLKVGLRYSGDLSEMNNEQIGAGSLKSNLFQVGIAYAFSQ